jgi:crotonobetainyl-CoA:carnitine CoA-transferase CaiB-like acyl-CoA transferase
VSKIKAIDQNIATHAPWPVLKAIYRNLQRLICARMKTARICTATTSGIEWDKVVNKSRRRITANVKDRCAIENVVHLPVVADVLVEGFRPSVTERLGLGPDVASARNQRIICARVTGWGQSGT